MIETSAQRWIELQQAQQGNKVDQKEQHDAPDADGLFGEETAQGIHVRCSPLDQLAGWSFAVISEGEALDMVEQVFAQPAGDSFGGEGCQPTAEVGKGTLQGCQANKAQGNPGQAGDGERRKLPGAVLAEHLVGKIAQQQEGGGFRQGAQADADIRPDINQAVACHHAPQPQQSIAGDGVFQVKCLHQNDLISVFVLTKDTDMDSILRKWFHFQQPASPWLRYPGLGTKKPG